MYRALPPGAGSPDADALTALRFRFDGHAPTTSTRPALAGLAWVGGPPARASVLRCQALVASVLGSPRQGPRFGLPPPVCWSCQSHPLCPWAFGPGPSALVPGPWALGPRPSALVPRARSKWAHARPRRGAYLDDWDFAADSAEERRTRGECCCCNAGLVCAPRKPAIRISVAVCELCGQI